MIKVMINNNEYPLIMGDLYSNMFSSYMNGDVIYLDNLNLPLRYKKVDELFGFVVRSFVVLLGDMQEENEEMEYSNDIFELRKKIDSVDRMQRFFHEKGNDMKSIQLMNDLMEKMLILYKKIFINDQNITKGSR